MPRSPAGSWPPALAVLLYVALGAAAGARDLNSHAGGHTITGAAPGLPTSAVTVHLFEWSWRDVALECEQFLGPAGYTAVQVSPPQEDIGGNAWWTRYQPVSYKLISRSGSPEEFADMVQRCAAAGVAVVVDAVMNHMAGGGGGSGAGRAGTPIGPGCRRFPEMYGDSCSDFHHQSDCCTNCQVATDTDLWRIRNCDLGLPDLATGSEWVQQKLAEYLRSLADLNVTGIRVDAAKHMPPEDLAAIVSRSGRQLQYSLEIIIPPWAPCAVDIQEYYGIGRVWEFKYSRLLSDAFKPADRRLDLLAQVPGYSGTQWADSEHAVSFVVNHDRLLHGADRPYTVTFMDGPLYPLALIFNLAHPFGAPTLLSSVTFSAADLAPNGDYNGAPVDPATGQLLPVHAADGSLNCGAGKAYLCEHRWPQVAAMVRWRQVAGTHPITIFSVLNSKSALALARGPQGGPGRAFVLINAAWRPGMEVHQRVQTGLPAGTYCNVLRGGDGCSSPVVVGGDGAAQLDVPLLSAVALHVEAMAPQQA